MENYTTRPGNIPKLQTYTVKEVAHILQVSERTAYNFCNATTDFDVKRIGRLIRIEKTSFDNWFGITE